MNKVFSFLMIFLFLTIYPFVEINSHEQHHGDLVEASKPYPEIDFEFNKLSENKVKIVFLLKNFKLLPIDLEDGEKLDSNKMKNSGHLLVEINRKEFMVDKNEFLIDANILSKGKNEVFVMLMYHSHNIYSIQGELIYKAKLLNF